MSLAFERSTEVEGERRAEETLASRRHFDCPCPSRRRRRRRRCPFFDEEEDSRTLRDSTARRAEPLFTVVSAASLLRSALPPAAASRFLASPSDAASAAASAAATRLRSEARKGWRSPALSSLLLFSATWPVFASAAVLSGRRPSRLGPAAATAAAVEVKARASGAAIVVAVCISKRSALMPPFSAVAAAERLSSSLSSLTSIASWAFLERDTKREGEKRRRKKERRMLSPRLARERRRRK